MVAGAVTEGSAIIVREPGEYQDVFAIGLERLEDPREFEFLTVRRRGPSFLDDAVWHIDERQAGRCIASESSRGGKRWCHSVQVRQRDGGTRPLQEEPAVQTFASNHETKPT